MEDKKARLRREQDILDRIENAKRLIQMETTLLTSEGADQFINYCLVNNKGEAVGSRWVNGLLNQLRREIQLQLLSIVALCYGDNPNVGEPMPILEWRSDSKTNTEDTFRDTWDKCLQWNA